MNANIMAGLRVIPLLLALCAGTQAADFGSAFTAYQQGDYDRAYREFSVLADRGDPDAQFMLGDLYAQGEGTARDPVKAYLWYELAARQGAIGAAAARDQIAGIMTAAQIAEARALAQDRTTASEDTETVAMPSPAPETTAPPADEPPHETDGGFFSNIARGTTGLLGGRQQQQHSPTVTATIGVRGISADELATAGANPSALEHMESHRVSQSEAAGFARHAQLVPQSVDYIHPQQPAGGTPGRQRAPIGPR